MSKSVLISVVAVVVVVVVTLSCVMYYRTTPEYKYNHAVKLLEAGVYASAKEELEQLGGYKDSADLIRQANVGMLRTRTLKAGDIIEFGDYNGKTTWRVLEVQGSDILIVSEDIVDQRKFHSSLNVWEESDLRTWLNGEYVNAAFTDYERKMIISKGDEVTLLTVDQAYKYFINAEDRTVPGADRFGWWLKDAGLKGDDVAIVIGSTEHDVMEYEGIIYQNGDVFEYGGDVFVKRGVRPVMWISIK